MKLCIKSKAGGVDKIDIPYEAIHAGGVPSLYVSSFFFDGEEKMVSVQANSYTIALVPATQFAGTWVER